MILKEILPNHPVDIQVRTNGPFGEDMLFGFCYWTGTELVSKDGDSYSLEEDVVRYEFSENKTKLVYWFESIWI